MLVQKIICNLCQMNGPDTSIRVFFQASGNRKHGHSTKNNSVCMKSYHSSTNESLHVIDCPLLTGFLVRSSSPNRHARVCRGSAAKSNASSNFSMRFSTLGTASQSLADLNIGLQLRMSGHGCRQLQAHGRLRLAGLQLQLTWTDTLSSIDGFSQTSLVLPFL